MKNEILQELKTGSLLPDATAANEYLTDMMLLLERHTQHRYAEEDFPVIRVERGTQLIIEEDDVWELIYFLFYVLLNHPDRAWAAAWALGKCYGHDIREGLCQGIESYMRKDDTTTFYLIKAISDSHPMNELDERTRSLFEKVSQDGMPQSREFVARLFELEQDTEG